MHPAGSADLMEELQRPDHSAMSWLLAAVRGVWFGLSPLRHVPAAWAWISIAVTGLVVIGVLASSVYAIVAPRLTSETWRPPLGPTQVAIAVLAAVATLFVISTVRLHRRLTGLEGQPLIVESRRRLQDIRRRLRVIQREVEPEHKVISDTRGDTADGPEWVSEDTQQENTQESIDSLRAAIRVILAPFPDALAHFDAGPKSRVTHDVAISRGVAFTWADKAVLLDNTLAVVDEVYGDELHLPLADRLRLLG